MDPGSHVGFQISTKNSGFREEDLNVKSSVVKDGQQCKEEEEEANGRTPDGQRTLTHDMYMS